MVMEAHPGLLEDLRARYGETGRHYHTFAHIEAMLALLDEARGRLHMPEAVEIAIYYHDAVYDPRSRTNEVDSADLMDRELAGLVPAATLEAARAMILATEKHQLPKAGSAAFRSDCACFLDMDLAILGAPKAEFDAYDAAIRKEYDFVPEDLYRAGRTQILSGFLARERLYFSDHFRHRFEARARENLARRLAGTPVD